jgi:hypothetical protein
MNKATLQRATSKAAFEWDPNKTQTYSLDQDLPLDGPAESFNKAPGVGFTMDASFGSLTLRPNDGGSTTWGTGTGDTATFISVERGAFTYETRLPHGILYLGSPQLETNLTVTNDAKFVVTSALSGTDEGLQVNSGGALNINVEGEGLLEISCAVVGMANNSLGDDYVIIAVSDLARMSVSAAYSLTLISATVSVNSTPDSGYSLSLTAGHTGDPTRSLVLQATQIGLVAQSNGHFRAPGLSLIDSRLRAVDTATCNFQFDSATVSETSRFILGAGTAKMQFDAYSDGAYPFDFRNDDPKKRYPAGMFDFTSDGTRNGGQFAIRVSSAFDANAIVTNGFVAIDGDVVGLDRVKAPFVGGYAIVTQS